MAIRRESRATSMLEQFMADLPQLIIGMHANASRAALEREKMRSQEMMALAELEISNLSTSRQIEMEKIENFRNRKQDLQDKTRSLTSAVQDLSDINVTSDFDGAKALDNIAAGYDGVLMSGIETSMNNLQEYSNMAATEKAKAKAAEDNFNMATRLHSDMIRNADLLAAQGSLPYQIEPGDMAAYFDNVIIPQLASEGKNPAQIANAERIWGGMGLATDVRIEFERGFKEHVTGQIVTNLDAGFVTMGTTWAGIQGDDTAKDALEGILSSTTAGAEAFDAMTDDQQVSMASEIAAAFSQSNGMQFMEYLNSTEEGQAAKSFLMMFRPFALNINNMQRDYEAYKDPFSLTTQPGLNPDNEVLKLLDKTTDPGELLQGLYTIYQSAGISGDKKEEDRLYDLMITESNKIGIKDLDKNIIDIVNDLPEALSTAVETLSGDIEGMQAQADLIRNSPDADSPDNIQKLINLNQQIAQRQRQLSGSEDIQSIQDVITERTSVRTAEIKRNEAKAEFTDQVSYMMHVPEISNFIRDKGIDVSNLTDNDMESIYRHVREIAVDWADNQPSVLSGLGFYHTAEDSRDLLAFWNRMEASRNKFLGAMGEEVNRAELQQALDDLLKESK